MFDEYHDVMRLIVKKRPDSFIVVFVVGIGDLLFLLFSIFSGEGGFEF